MRSDSSGRRGVLVYAVVAIVGATAMSALFQVTDSSADGLPLALVIPAMWVPALARWIATRTVDRAWRSPFPVRRWGYPRSAIIIVPLTVIIAVYPGAYLLASWAGVLMQPPVWQGDKTVVNVALSLPVLVGVGLLGALGEEVGWRGYLQPRLDQLGVPGSLFVVITLEACFHVPFILMAGYLATESPAISIALFFGLKLGATTVWTWATYRWRSIWIAAWFHTFHNAASLVLMPNLVGAGSPLVLGESGVLPVAFYLFAAGVVFARIWARGDQWSELVGRVLHEREQPREITSAGSG